MTFALGIKYLTLAVSACQHGRCYDISLAEKMPRGSIVFVFNVQTMRNLESLLEVSFIDFRGRLMTLIVPKRRFNDVLRAP